MIIRKTGNEAIDANTVDLDDRVRQLEQNALLRGRHITGISLPAGVATPIRHQLGRTPLGYLPTGMSGAVAAGYINVTSKDATFLTLTATGYGATIAASIWVF